MTAFGIGAIAGISRYATGGAAYAASTTLATNILFGTGISWGRTSWANISETDGTALYNHEGTHWRQQQKDGFARFYGTIAKDYINSIRQFGSTYPLYNGTYLPGNYEDIATQIEHNKITWTW